MKPYEMTSHSARMAALRLADSLAEFALLGCVDKQGQPLIEHCRRVAASCRNLSQEQRIAALLHDVVEDSDVTLATIRELFGPGVEAIVSALTRRKKEGESYTSYIERVEMTPAAILVKLADLNDSLDESRGSFPAHDSLRTRYVRAKEQLGLAIARGALDSPGDGDDLA